MFRGEAAESLGKRRVQAHWNRSPLVSLLSQIGLQPGHRGKQVYKALYRVHENPVKELREGEGVVPPTDTGSLLSYSGTRTEH